MIKGNKYKLFPSATFPYASGVITSFIGLIVIMGWYFNIDIIKSPLHGTDTMKVNTAIVFILSGLSLILLLSEYYYAVLGSRLFAILVFVIGFVSLIENILYLNAGLNEILIGNYLAQYSGRMALNTSLNFTLIGFSLFCLSCKFKRHTLIPVFCLVFPLTISIAALLGYITGFVELAAPAGYEKMPVHTAFTFIILCSGMLLLLQGEQKGFHIEQKLFSGLTTAATLTILILVLSISGSKSVVKLSDWVEEAQHVKNQFDHIYEHLMDIESGDLIYLHNGDEKYLAMYKKGIDDLLPILNNLKKETSGNPAQAKLLERLDGLVKQRIELSKKRIEARKTKSQALVLDLYPIVSGKLLVDSIRIIAVKMISEQERVVEIRNAVKIRQDIRNRFIIYSSLGLEVLLLGFIFIVVTKDVLGRRKAEEEIKLHRDHLEVLVNQRTTELTAANEQLKDKIEREKEVEILLKSSLEKEKEVSEMKSRFISNSSHEFRTPLTTIQSSVQLVQKYRNKWNDGKLEDHFARIKFAISALTQMLDNILTISHSDTGIIVLAPKTTDLYKFCQELIEEVKILAKENHKFNFIFSSSERYFLIDTKIVRLILINVFTNAVKFSPGGGEINIIVCPNEELINITVSDEGIGIPEADLNHIFEPFFRAGNAREIEGTGLGLAIAQRSVKIHHGEITCDSEISKGAKFSIIIPLAS